MGERKGTNKYYPPDYDPKYGSLNAFRGTHALRERARKIHMGIIIIRFEMPYNIWCEGCNNHIGMGVRYNAEKTKVGMYYTTPVYQFKMKCHLCDNHFVIKTDPGNLDYVILSGARRQENRWDPTKNEQVVPETKEIQKRLFDDSMFKLEHGSQDQSAADKAKPRLIKLFEKRESLWADSYTANQKLRENFRKRNRDFKHSTERDDVLLKKSSLDIPLLPEREEDKKYAALLSKVPCRTSTENSDLFRKRIIATPALPTKNLNIAREQKALKALNSKDLGILVKRTNKSSTVVVEDAEVDGKNETSVQSIADKRSDYQITEDSNSVNTNNNETHKQNNCELKPGRIDELQTIVENAEHITNNSEDKKLGLDNVGNRSTSGKSTVSLVGDYGSSSSDSD